MNEMSLAYLFGVVIGGFIGFGMARDMYSKRPATKPQPTREAPTAGVVAITKSECACGHDWKAHRYEDRLSVWMGPCAEDCYCGGFMRRWVQKTEGGE